jgi:dihydrofolate reductase
MIISLIVAASDNQVIGKNNQLLWHLPDDMRYFKNMTWGMPVVMGRRTFESIGNKPLPGRFNIIISRNGTAHSASEHLQGASSLEEALKLARKTECRECFIVGGGQIYEASMPISDRIYMTRVHATFEGDTFFPDFDEKEWKLVRKNEGARDEKHAYPHTFEIWERK